MSLMKITLPSMIAIVDNWRTTARGDFDRPFLTAILPVVDAWAEDAAGVDDLQANQTEAKALRARARALDVEHDQLLGDIYAYLTGLSGLHPDGAAVLAVRDALMPDGLRMKTRSYQQQGVAVKTAQKRLTDEVRAALTRFSAPDANLLGSVERWIAVGVELQGVDAERSNTAGESTQLRRDLRTRWLRMYKAIEQGAEWSDLDEATRSRLFSTVRDAVR